MRRFISRFAIAAPCLAALLCVAGIGQAQDKAQDDKEKPKAETKQPPKDEGREKLLQAYEISKTAKTDKEYSQMIELCEQGIAGTSNAAFKAYGQKLVAFAHYKRGEEYAKDPKTEKEALTDFNASAKYLEGVPANERPDWEYDLLHNRGVSLAMAGEYDKALADFDRVLELRPNYGKEYFNRGEVYYAKGDLNKAITEYGQAIRYGYTDSVVYTRRGTTYFRQADIRRALADYNQAIARNARDYEAYTFRGDVHAANGNFAQALRDYVQAIELNEKYDRVYYSAAWLRATCPEQQFRDAELALRSARKAIELGGENHRYLEALAAAQARAGDFDEAVAAQKKAIDKIPPELKDELETAKSRLALYEKKTALVSQEGSGGQPKQ
jgi:tetratricopeptide (TPR) repeat protein